MEKEEKIEAAYSDMEAALDSFLTAIEDNCELIANGETTPLAGEDPVDQLCERLLVAFGAECAPPAVKEAAKELAISLLIYPVQIAWRLANAPSEGLDAKAREIMRGTLVKFQNET